MIYPERQAHLLSGPSGRHSFPETCPERHTSNVWQQQIDHRVKQEHMDNKSIVRKYRPEQMAGNGSKPSSTTRSNRRQMSSHSMDSNLNKAAETVHMHYPGFQGSPERQAINLKYKFGKKKPGDEPQQPTTFRPKGFGMLYDELEFERRYKKVFDVNKQMHFVHTNFVSGQKICKRSKLPPIGHIPSLQSEDSDTKDIFAIMSVQRFNHPEESKLPRAPVSSPGENERLTQSLTFETMPLKVSRKSIELPQDAGFIPGTIRFMGYSNVEGVKGQTQSKVSKEGSFRLSLNNREDDSAVGSLCEENSQQVYLDDKLELLSVRTASDWKTKPFDESKSRRQFNKTWDDSFKENNLPPPETPESEPFNISVRVNIKPRDGSVNGSDDNENERAREHRRTIEEEREAEAELRRRDTAVIPTILEVNERESNEPDLKQCGEKRVQKRYITSSLRPNGVVVSEKLNPPNKLQLGRNGFPVEDRVKTGTVLFRNTREDSDADSAKFTYSSKSTLNTYVVKGPPRGTV